MSEMDMEEPEFKAKQLRFEYSTSDLIAELEKRRHELCPKCANGKSVLCVECVWAGVYRAYRKDDNFKEAK